MYHTLQKRASMLPFQNTCEKRFDFHKKWLIRTAASSSIHSNHSRSTNTSNEPPLSKNCLRTQLDQWLDWQQRGQKSQLTALQPLESNFVQMASLKKQALDTWLSGRHLALGSPQLLALGSRHSSAANLNWIGD